MTFAVFNTCSNDDESRRLKHCQLSFFAIFATFCSRVFSGWISGSADERTRLGPLGRSLPSHLSVVLRLDRRSQICERRREKDIDRAVAAKKRFVENPRRHTHQEE
jgi:hypothetical protein